MDKLWRFNGFIFQIALYLFLCLLGFSSSLSTEGLALLRLEEKVVRDSYWNFRDGEEKNPCSLFGVRVLSFLIHNKKFLGGKTSELEVDENQQSTLAQEASSGEILNTWSAAKVGDQAYRRLLQVNAPGFIGTRRHARRPTRSSSSLKPPSSSSPSPSPLPSIPSPSPAQDPSSPAPANPPPPTAPSFASLPPLPSASPSPSEGRSKDSKKAWPIIFIVAGASVLLISVIGVLLCRNNKVVTVKPWVTGLSGQLQKAFVTGVPKLKRSELEAACEDFSNIIGSSSDGTMYKGTLSSGVEIAVTSSAVLSAEDWSKHLEGKFRKKIDMLSKINHKNFVNLIGFCEEEEPFTRMMVFEYASNGTLFEHLHVKEAEHLDWGLRLRIAMGMAYCLEYMHQISPPMIHKNLLSNSVYLTEDYAAKISDLGFWTDATAAKMGSTEGTESFATPSLDPESNIYSFGLILLEMITGRLQYSVEYGRLEDWARDYLRKERPLADMVDSTLKHFHEGELDKLCEVIRSCIHVDPKQRPTIREVTTQLRAITTLTPGGATPKLSPLWWAELEIISTEAP